MEKNCHELIILSANIILSLEMETDQFLEDTVIVSFVSCFSSENFFSIASQMGCNPIL